MEYQDAIDFFNNYRNHINDKSKVTIGYDSTIKIVEAYELLEGHIQDLTEECTRKQNLIDVQNKLIESMQCCGNCDFSNDPDSDRSNGGCFGCKEIKDGVTILHGWINREDN